MFIQGIYNSLSKNIGVVVRAWAYILNLGPQGLRSVAENAVLNANYLRKKIGESYDIPYGDYCMHEFAASASKQKSIGIRALDIAKRLIDYGYHPPTIYFPLIVHETLMIEPTETESIETLDAFADAMLAIAEECHTEPDMLHEAPHDTPVSRLDEAVAARNPELKWEKK